MFRRLFDSLDYRLLRHLRPRLSLASASPQDLVRHRRQIQRLQRPDVDLALRLIAGEGAVVDIGANIGLFSLLVMEGGFAGTVHLFEPHPTLVAASRLLLNDHHHRCRFHEYGLSDRACRSLLFTARDGNVGWNTLDSRFAEGMDRVEVELRDRLPDEIGAVQLVKIDVEGHEDRVLACLAPEIDRRLAGAPVIVEVSAGNWEPRRCSALAKASVHPRRPRPPPGNAGP